MSHRIRTAAAVLATSATLALGACGGHDSAPANTTTAGTPAATTTSNGEVAQPEQHHSKLAGAVVGGVVGHMVGHTAAGAVAGAAIQHHRNHN